MAFNASIQTQVNAIKARIDAVAATATPDDIVMLAKAVEAIAGQVTVFDVIEIGDQKVAAIEGAFVGQIDAGMSAIDDSKTQALSDIAKAKAAALTQINPNNFSLAAVQAASLSL
jgi:hypothetical protein